jgi:acyl carrier protein
MEELFLEKFREVLDISDKELQLDDNFREYEEWNSLVFLSLIAMIDEDYDVIIDGKDFKLLKTNADIIQAIKDRQS